MSSTNKDANLQHEQGKKDYQLNQKEDQNRVEKTTITFEKKHEKQVDDKDMKNIKHDSSATSGEGGASKGGIINTIKEKVKDVLGSGDNDKDIKDKSWEKEKTLEKDKNLEKDKHISSEHDKNVGFSGDKYATSEKDKYSANLNLDKDKKLEKDKNLEKDKYAAGANFQSGSASMGQDKQNFQSGSASGANYKAGSAAMGHHEVQSGKSDIHTIDRTGLGAEHREVGYDKTANVVPNKNKVEDKDTAHKLDVHATVKTGSSAGSTSGSGFQGATYKTTESK